MYTCIHRKQHLSYTCEITNSVVPKTCTNLKAIPLLAVNNLITVNSQHTVLLLVNCEFSSLSINVVCFLAWFPSTPTMNNRIRWDDLLFLDGSSQALDLTLPFTIRITVGHGLRSSR